ncbi:T9SS type A sorting domain-containing protein [bacterium]|nr:T9SS type A sorting domain-containing protein [bacterium]
MLRLDSAAFSTLVLLAVAAAAAAPAREIVVPVDAVSIRAGLNLAEPGDIVLLEPGRYHEPYLELKDGVVVRGDVDDPAAVVVDAGDISNVFVARNVTDARIEGLTIVGGLVDGPTRFLSSGSGVLVSLSDVTLHRVRMIGNHAEYAGGGVRVLHGSVEISESEFIACTAGKGGGAIDLSYNSEARITDTRFEGNRAQWGGAISARSNSACIIERCDFLVNEAVEPVDLGGAFFADYAASVSFFGCLFAGNTASKGGAACLSEAVAGFGNCTVDGNSADEIGGGFLLRSGSLVLDHSIVSGNTGEGVAVEAGQAWITTTDIFGNSGGDWIGPIEILLEQGGNLSADPLYCDEDVYTLSEDSPCAPAQSGVGLIGAREVGCENVSIDLQSFTARVQGTEVQLAWVVVDADGWEFRLTGRSEAGQMQPDWTVRHKAGDEPGRFTATDKPARALFPVLYRLEARESAGADWLLLGERRAEADPIRDGGLDIGRVFPNPFNPNVTIELRLGEDAPVRAVIYDVQGRRVRTLVDETLPSGRHALTWDSRDDQGRELSTGTYLLQIIGNGPVQTRKLLLVK